jgi:probable F420-dependent oxidoreductase
LEPLTLFSFIAGITTKLGLATSVLIMPQRQTVLLAKQAATLDVLSGGKLRLGVGIGWNEVEYEAHSENFHDRGQRSEEQIELMRQLWRGRSVNFEGRWHRVTDAGITPLPVQRPIPVWLGGGASRSSGAWHASRTAGYRSFRQTPAGVQRSCECGNTLKRRVATRMISVSMDGLRRVGTMSKAGPSRSPGGKRLARRT